MSLRADPILLGAATGAGTAMGGPRDPLRDHGGKAHGHRSGEVSDIVKELTAVERSGRRQFHW